MGVFDHFKKQDKTHEAGPDISAGPQLTDFHPFDTGLSQTILELSAEFGKKLCPPAPLAAGSSSSLCSQASLPCAKRPAFPAPASPARTILPPCPVVPPPRRRHSAAPTWKKSSASRTDAP